MTDNLANDSSKTFIPILYQFYIALEKCFELLENESVYIEKYGDVTVSDDVQIEVKDFQTNLTNLDHNIWKTLKNWLNREFDESKYKNLILLTTQSLGKQSRFHKWNALSAEKKYEILAEIKNIYVTNKTSDTTKTLVETVLNVQTKMKLLSILKKFTISSNYMKDDALYENLQQKHLKMFPESKSEVLNALFGFINSPDITSNGWAISYEMFSNELSSLAEKFIPTTRRFPIKYALVQTTPHEINKFFDEPFIQKIKDIKYEDVISDSIRDFVRMRSLVNEELNKYRTIKEDYDVYSDEIYSTYKSKYRDACLDTSSKTQIRDSKKLFNAVTSRDAEAFKNFNDTPKYFRNGLLHELANDDTQENIIIWKVKEEDE